MAGPDFLVVDEPTIASRFVVNLINGVTNED